MKKLLVIILFSLGMNAQIDKHGNPVFNSISVKEEQIPGGLTLLSNYYTLENNIENKDSSVYISDSPSGQEVIDSAIRLPSDFFIATRNGDMVAMLMFITYPDQVIVIIDPATGVSKEIPVKIKGKITQHRAEEILKQQYDSQAKLLKGELTFKGKKYPVISTDDIHKEILSAIEKERLSEKQASGSRLLSKEAMRGILLEESKEGGELIFLRL